MAQITKAVNVDVAMENLPLRVVAKQNDIDSRFLKATIRNEGVPIDVPSDAVVKINVMRADKKSGAFVGTVNSDGTVTVPLTDWVLGCAGIARCSISIIGPDEQKLTSTSFALDVDAAECPGADVTESGNYEARVAALDALFKIAVYKGDASTAYSAFRAAFGLDETADEGGDGGGGESGGGESTSEGGDTGKTLLDTFLDNVDVDYAYDADTGAYYTVIRVYKQKLDGTKQYPFVYAPNGANAGDKSTYDMTVGDGWLLAINSGVFNTGTKKPDGIVIQNGGVIQNSPTATHSQCKPLTIDRNGNLGYAAYDADADDLVSDGIVSAVCGFMPIVVDYVAVDSSEWNSVSHYTQNAQRQIVGQWGNGDYAIITCEGRGYHNSDGWTIAEAQAVCIKHGLKFAYNLDGGGSTETMLGLKHINTIYERTTGRIVPTFIVFNGSDSFGEGVHSHSYSVSVTTEATCTTDGVRTYTCSCGNSYTEVIPTTGHNYVDGVCTVCGTADPDYVPDATLTGISATYSGGDVPAGTELTELTGIEVVATYDDGNTSAVAGYTLSGEITKGENTIIVAYGGMTATFVVTGVAKSYAITNSLTNVTNSNAASIVEENASYTATLTVTDGYELNTVTVTMGGEDVTADVYVDGVVNISAVTGDVVITATAMVPMDGYTVLTYIATTTASYIQTSIEESAEPYDIDYEAQPVTGLQYGGGHIFSSASTYYPFAATDAVKHMILGEETRGGAISLNAWYKVCGRARSSTYITVFYNEDGSEARTITGSIGSTYSSSNTFAIFAYGGGAGVVRYRFVGKLKYLKLSKSGVVEHYFVPVTEDATGTIGLLDKMTGTFYSSATTTAFTGA